MGSIPPPQGLHLSKCTKIRKSDLERWLWRSLSIGAFPQGLFYFLVCFWSFPLARCTDLIPWPWPRPLSPKPPNLLPSPPTLNCGFHSFGFRRWLHFASSSRHSLLQKLPALHRRRQPRLRQHPGKSLTWLICWPRCLRSWPPLPHPILIYLIRRIDKTRPLSCKPLP